MDSRVETLIRKRAGYNSSRWGTKGAVGRVQFSSGSIRKENAMSVIDKNQLHEGGLLSYKILAIA